MRPSIRKIHCSCVRKKKDEQRGGIRIAYLPSSESRTSVEFLDTVGEETAEGAGERGSDVEDGHAALEFEAAVPEGEEKCCCWEETGLKVKKSQYVVVESGVFFFQKHTSVTPKKNRPARRPP